MGLNKLTINFNQISKEYSLRYDVDYTCFQNEFNISQYYSFNQLFEIKSEEIDLKEINDDFLYSEISNVTKHGDVFPVTLNFNDKNDLNANYYKKIEKGDIINVNNDEILLSKVRPNLKKYVFITDKTKNIFFTSAFIRLKPRIINKLLYYSLRNIFYNNLISVSRQGKGYPTLKEKDLNTLKFDKQIIDNLIKNEKNLLNKIEPIEKNISKLKTSLNSQTNIINNVFTKYFNFDVEQFERIKKIKQYSLSFSKFSNNKDLRQSVKFHRKSGQFIYKELQKITDKKIKHFISEQTLLGSSISPECYDENGDYYYVSMGDIKTWYLDKENCKTVSNLYSTSNINKTIQKNDIIMARSGEGTIGKVSLIEDDIIQGIFCDFTMRIRVKNCNPKFVYYYFRTDYFQYLIEINKKGLGNNTNIFPIQLQELPMIDIPIAEQNKIVKLIETEIKKQNEIQEQIEQEREKIDLIIIKSINKQKDGVFKSIGSDKSIGRR